jgi:succinate dehydrogenase / fumarate reductase cytochrome b subunit
MNVLAGFYENTIGKKYVMAASGVILWLYLVGHMLGNLQIFEGPGPIDRYAHFLHSHMIALWLVRSVLLLCIGLHVLAGLQVTVQNWNGRQRYAVSRYREADLMSRTMIWGGLALAGFIVFHILHLTSGVVGLGFVEGTVYRNVVAGFQVPAVSVAYIFAMFCLAMHLYHGLWSMFQSMGLAHPRYNGWRRAFAVLFAFGLFLGFVSVPVSVLIGRLS